MIPLDQKINRRMELFLKLAARVGKKSHSNNKSEPAELSSKQMLKKSILRNTFGELTKWKAR